MAGPSKSASQRASRSEPQPDDRKHILLEPYCLLCRDTLLYQKYWLPSKHEPEELLPWKVNVFCCKLASKIWHQPNRSTLLTSRDYLQSSSTSALRMCRHLVEFTSFGVT